MKMLTEYNHKQDNKRIRLFIAICLPVGFLIAQGFIKELISTPGGSWQLTILFFLCIIAATCMIKWVVSFIFPYKDPIYTTPKQVIEQPIDWAGIAYSDQLAKELSRMMTDIYDEQAGNIRNGYYNLHELIFLTEMEAILLWHLRINKVVPHVFADLLAEVTGEGWPKVKDTQMPPINRVRSEKSRMPIVNVTKREGGGFTESFVRNETKPPTDTPKPQHPLATGKSVTPSPETLTLSDQIAQCAINLTNDIGKDNTESSRPAITNRNDKTA